MKKLILLKTNTTVADCIIYNFNVFHERGKSFSLAAPMHCIWGTSQSNCDKWYIALKRWFLQLLWLCWAFLFFMCCMLCWDKFIKAFRQTGKWYPQSQNKVRNTRNLTLGGFATFIFLPETYWGLRSFAYTLTLLTRHMQGGIKKYQHWFWPRESRTVVIPCVCHQTRVE